MQEIKDSAPPTEEERKRIKEYNEKRLQYLEEHLPLLRQEVEFEECLFKIENFRYNQAVLKVKRGEINVPPGPDQKPEETKK